VNLTASRRPRVTAGPRSYCISGNPSHAEEGLPRCLFRRDPRLPDADQLDALLVRIGGLVSPTLTTCSSSPERSMEGRACVNSRRAQCAPASRLAPHSVGCTNQVLWSAEKIQLVLRLNPQVLPVFA
jgi:hypothetical protein